MIVDPIRHITDILALGGIFLFAYALAWSVNAIAEVGRRRPKPEPALQPVPVLANDNAAARAQPVDTATKLAA
jgi:hypothetical protein